MIKVICVFDFINERNLLMLDKTDVLILKELSQNSRITMKELGEKVHLSSPATSARVMKLEEQGIIEGYTVKLNQDKLGYPIHAFITIFNKSDRHQPYLLFVETQNQHVINNHKISGEGCYLLECKFSSNKSLGEFLTELNKHTNYKCSIVIN